MIIQYLAFAVTRSEGSDGSLWPAVLVAMILNSYSCPSVKSGTVA